MKHAESKALKDGLRDVIRQQRKMLYKALHTLHKIPPHIVNGSLTGVQTYKRRAEKIGGNYHVNNEPGWSLTHKKLVSVKNKLHSFMQEMGLVDG